MWFDLSAYGTTILVMKEQQQSEKRWIWTKIWLHLSKLISFWFEFITASIRYGGNDISEVIDDLIQSALKINIDLAQLWARRHNLLIFLSHLSRSHFPSTSEGILLHSLNVMKVIEIEEMKREISYFLWSGEIISRHIDLHLVFIDLSNHENWFYFGFPIPL